MLCLVLAVAESHLEALGLYKSVWVVGIRMRYLVVNYIWLFMSKERLLVFGFEFGLLILKLCLEIL